MITNYLSPLEFQVAIKRLPNVEFFTQKATLPGISGSAVEMSGPLNKIFHTQDKLNYEDFSMSFIIDEKMGNYMEILNWIKGISSPENYEQYKNIKNSDEGLYSDISVIILNSMKNKNLQWNFYNCFPINLSGIDLDTTNSDITYPESTATFKYDYYDIEIKNT